MPMPEEKIFIIAEGGVNHNGSMDMARRLVDAAADAGADADMRGLSGDVVAFEFDPAGPGRLAGGQIADPAMCRGGYGKTEYFRRGVVTEEMAHQGGTRFK